MSPKVVKVAHAVGEPMCEYCGDLPVRFHVHAQWGVFDWLDAWVCDDCLEDVYATVARRTVDGRQPPEIWAEPSES